MPKLFLICCATDLRGFVLFPWFLERVCVFVCVLFFPSLSLRLLYRALYRDWSNYRQRLQTAFCPHPVSPVLFTSACCLCVSLCQHSSTKHRLTWIRKVKLSYTLNPACLAACCDDLVVGQGGEPRNLRLCAITSTRGASCVTYCWLHLACLI